jgi:hypothetical protein
MKGDWSIVVILIFALRSDFQSKIQQIVGFQSQFNPKWFGVRTWFGPGSEKLRLPEHELNQRFGSAFTPNLNTNPVFGSGSNQVRLRFALNFDIAIGTIS